jgi:hypothetical protein
MTRSDHDYALLVLEEIVMVLDEYLDCTWNPLSDRFLVGPKLSVRDFLDWFGQDAYGIFTSYASIHRYPYPEHWFNHILQCKSLRLFYPEVRLACQSYWELYKDMPTMHRFAVLLMSSYIQYYINRRSTNNVILKCLHTCDQFVPKDE